MYGSVRDREDHPVATETDNVHSTAVRDIGIDSSDEVIQLHMTPNVVRHGELSAPVEDRSLMFIVSRRRRKLGQKSVLLRQARKVCPRLPPGMTGKICAKSPREPDRNTAEKRRAIEKSRRAKPRPELLERSHAGHHLRYVSVSLFNFSQANRVVERFKSATSISPGAAEDCDPWTIVNDTALLANLCFSEDTFLARCP
ncbi:hypothetical protein Micbo1qcDRAFT_181439 [Microdochium bolleyi]|uniref:Uncharacterized protein n=1 Tax=Microdochium bolleyi TaxID=196109 RepID=A0A136II92_9PEZI|nr:hypothetical protein Micbo1qcDRAFT_181439 [Microdochium bolleyi]